ncbi:MAG TPA: SAM-dependent tRNA/rRNA cytosine-C5 methylase, partial [Nitrososphaera sp.]|nr:SAM-dependent tRNA/rRNA cytosine-C5 methylase [Nitrososphaera sp.]
IGRDPSRKKSHSPADVRFCSDRQERLIEAAAAAVKPGGILVYSTCSFAPEEDEAVVQHLLSKFKGATVEPFGAGKEGLAEFGDLSFDRQIRNARRFYPHIDNTTGFFIARIRVS